MQTQCRLLHEGWWKQVWSFAQAMTCHREAVPDTLAGQEPSLQTTFAMDDDDTENVASRNSGHEMRGDGRHRESHPKASAGVGSGRSRLWPIRLWPSLSNRLWPIRLWPIRLWPNRLWPNRLWPTLRFQLCVKILVFRS